ncbi:MAG: leucine-rich repeat domain-containing protein [Clostridia bacterium]|nr:leucine-rich repeat domain-containing protein [Clostridia bacterium]
MKNIVMILSVLLFAAVLLTACEEGGQEQGEQKKQCEEHAWSEWQTVTPAWCGAAGTQKRSCAVCQALETKVLEATGAHNYVNGVCTVCNAKQSVECLTYTELDDGTAYAVSGLGTLTDIHIVIPDTHNGKPVSTIDPQAFSGCDSIVSITIPASVTSIGELAFYNCTGLARVTFGENSQLQSIGEKAFIGCGNLTSITIPPSVTSIGPWAFYGCTGISQTENGVSYVDKWMIGCDTSVSDVILRADTVGIGGCAFYGCNGLTSVTLPSSVKSICEGAFFECNNLASVIIPTSVTSIGKYAFDDCSSLASITIPTSVTSIGEGAFIGCDSLTSITIPTSVTSIGRYAFLGCGSLASIMLENCEGWQAYLSVATSGTEISSADLANASTAAAYFTGTYSGCYWKRNC